MAPTARAAEPAGVARAKASLAKGDYEQVLFDLDGSNARATPEGARLLAGASTLALAKDDRAIAGVTCQMALSVLPREEKALRVCAEVALAEQRFDDAARHAAVLGALKPKDPAVRALRAEAAAGDGAWAEVEALLKGGQGLSAREQALLQGAEDALAAARQADEDAAMRARLDQAVADARKLQAPEPARAKAVTVYSTSWCPSCKELRRYLQQKGIAFEEHDVERSPGARREAREKCVRAGLRVGAVPVVDVGGQVMVGFDPEAIEAALR